MAINIPAQIRATLNASLSSLTPVLEIQRDTTEDAIHKLQIMIFQLSDELVKTHTLIDKLTRPRR